MSAGAPEGVPVSFRSSPPFPIAAKASLGDARLRANLARATGTIRRRREAVVAELPDFEELRRAAAAIKDDALSRLPELLERLTERVGAAGGSVHVARDAAEARRIVCDLVLATGERQVVKVKSMTTAEVELNPALEAAGIDVAETDLAELIVQLGRDLPSHIVVPAIHRNRAEIRSTFLAEMGRRGRPAPTGLTDEPADLASAARLHLRERFLSAKVAISGANFAVASTGSLVVVESEGNGRMCLTLSDTLISLVGIDKLIPDFADLEVFLQLLARSATGERLSPYTSLWSGVTPGDGPQQVHLVLLDNGRSSALADPVGRQALRCIRCAACLNVCPVYERVGGHAYGSVYPGPIGAVLTPQLDHVASQAVAAALPWASTLCGACFEVCPVRIDIPKLLVHLRGETVARRREGALLPGAEDVAMAGAALVLGSPQALRAAEALGDLAGRAARRLGWPWLHRLPPPLSAWTDFRDAPVPAGESFRAWWGRNRGAARRPPPPVAVRRRPPARRVLARLSARTATARTRRWRLRPPLSAGRCGDARQGAPGEGSREVVLRSVRSALEAAPMGPISIPRQYRRAGSAAPAGNELVARFAERVGHYSADVVVAEAGDVPAAIAAALARYAESSLVVPADLPAAWLEGLGDQVRLVRDDGSLGTDVLDGVAAVVTAARLGIATTGTIVLDGGPAQGRRAITLLPDHHVVVVRAAQLVADVPDAIAELEAAPAQTWISGPSATSDIELQRVEGVHGPRRLDVVVELG